VSETAARPTRKLLKRLKRIAAKRPALGLRLAAGFGYALGPRVGAVFVPSAQQLTTLLGPMKSGAVRRLQRRIAAQEFRTHVHKSVLRRRGAPGMLPLVRIASAEPLLRLRREGTPVVAVFWHCGARGGVELGLIRLGVLAYVAMLSEPRRPDPGFRWDRVFDPFSSVRFLKQSAKELAQGTVVVMSLDGVGGTPLEDTTFLGCHFPFARGPAILARRAGARLVPTTTRWMGMSGRIEVTFHDPLPEPAVSRKAEKEFEDALRVSGARFFDRHLRAHPELLVPGNVRRCLGFRREDVEVADRGRATG
jgi:hypothetical protein